jgi:hypothetical protein
MNKNKQDKNKQFIFILFIQYAKLHSASYEILYAKHNVI